MQNFKDTTGDFKELLAPRNLYVRYKYISQVCKGHKIFTYFIRRVIVNHHIYSYKY